MKDRRDHYGHELSGLISGMDTETVIRELMKAESLKTTKVENKITTTEWKQEKWSALNTPRYTHFTLTNYQK